MGFSEQYQWLLSRPEQYAGAVMDYKEEWEAHRLLVNGKMFALIGENKEKKATITLKGYPEKNEQYRTMYEYVEAGYYMNKEHWISIVLDHPDLDRDFVCSRLLDSYQLVVQKLPKKVRETIKDMGGLQYEMD